MKQPTNKPATNLGHNNPPEDIKSIEFTNSAIEKLRVDNLDASFVWPNKINNNN